MLHRVQRRLKAGERGRNLPFLVLSTRNALLPSVAVEPGSQPGVPGGRMLPVSPGLSSQAHVLVARGPLLHGTHHSPPLLGASACPSSLLLPLSDVVVQRQLCGYPSPHMASQDHPPERRAPGNSWSAFSGSWELQKAGTCVAHGGAAWQLPEALGGLGPRAGLHGFARSPSMSLRDLGLLLTLCRGGVEFRSVLLKCCLVYFPYTCEWR